MPRHITDTRIPCRTNAFSCGHCCGYEWGLTIPGQSKYLSLGDIHSPAGTRHPLELRQSWPATIKKLQNFDLTALRPKNICVKPRKMREDLKPGLFCRYIHFPPVSKHNQCHEVKRVWLTLCAATCHHRIVFNFDMSLARNWNRYWTHTHQVTARPLSII